MNKEKQTEQLEAHCGLWNGSKHVKSGVSKRSHIPYSKTLSLTAAAKEVNNRLLVAPE